MALSDDDYRQRRIKDAMERRYGNPSCYYARPSEPTQLVKSPTGRVLVCFIGGPLHLTEKEYPDTEFKTVRHSFMMDPGPIRPLEDFTLGASLPFEAYTYNLGLTPSTLTSFSTHPLIIALFDSA